MMSMWRQCIHFLLWPLSASGAAAADIHPCLGQHTHAEPWSSHKITWKIIFLNLFHTIIFIWLALGFGARYYCTSTVPYLQTRSSATSAAMGEAWRVTKSSMCVSHVESLPDLWDVHQLSGRMAGSFTCSLAKIVQKACSRSRYQQGSKDHTWTYGDVAKVAI
jgi:hypothetical protein